MAATNDAALETPVKSSRKPLILGLVIALVLGGAGFYAVQSGLILSPAPTGDAHDAHPKAKDLPHVAFVPIEPLVINLSRGGANKYLRFRAELEVEPEYADDVTRLLPRVVDVLNSYLRAVSLKDLEEPATLIRLRAQMLRRAQIVTGEGRIRDLLIMEFVLN